MLFKVRDGRASLVKGSVPSAFKVKSSPRPPGRLPHGEEDRASVSHGHGRSERGQQVRPQPTLGAPRLLISCGSSGRHALSCSHRHRVPERNVALRTAPATVESALTFRSLRTPASQALLARLLSAQELGTWNLREKIHTGREAWSCPRGDTGVRGWRGNRLSP